MNQSKLITRAELPNIHTAFGNIGNSWNNSLPNDLFIRGMPKYIVKDFTTSGNLGAGLDSLKSYTIPAGTLKDDDFVIGIASGKYAANDNNKRVVLAIPGVATIEDGLGAAQDIDGGGGNVGWNLFYGFARRDSTTLVFFSKFSGEFISFDGAGASVVNLAFHHFNRNLDGVTVSDLDSNDLVIDVEGEGTSNNDITQDFNVVQLTRF